MMLYPPMADLVDKIGSRYQLVNLVARRARAISANAEEKQIPLRADEPILTAVERAGISAPSRCRSGECGWCHSKLVKGKVYVPKDADGRRAADEKYGWIHPCVSFPLSDIEMCVYPTA